MTNIIFSISIFCLLVILIFSLPSFFSEKFRFFPPPALNTWQYYLFWALFRCFFIGLIVLSFVEFDNDLGSVTGIIGLVLLALGIGFSAYLSYSYLGKTNSYGGKYGLKINGFYRWSRNPIYVFSIVGMVGWGLLVNSNFVWVLLGLWCVLYILAPFVEEPWLEQQYGQEYILYREKTPRFIGIVKE